MVDATTLAPILVFGGLTLIATVFSVYAYVSLRRLDDVLLKTRMYMNRTRLFAGFLALALAMLVFLALILAAVGAALAGVTLPPAATLVTFGAFFVLLAWGFYNFYAMSRAPARGAGKEEG